MRDQEQNEKFESFRNTLQSALPPMGDQQPARDLWPGMLQRIEQARSRRPFRVPWFDWALLGAAAAVLFFFPALIPALLYHL